MVRLQTPCFLNVPCCLVQPPEPHEERRALEAQKERARPRGPSDLFIQAVDGGEPGVLYESEEIFKNPYGWSPDGSFIAVEWPSRETGWDIWKLPVDGDRRPVPLVRAPFNEGGGWFSPDGRWLIYYSDETGLYELYAPTALSRK